MGALDKLLSRAERDQNGCLVWTGVIHRHGYGQVRFARRTQSAHRVAYELARGPVPDGLVIDHLCRNRACINPEHMEPVTNAENIRRGIRGQYATRTHCKYGHEFTPENTYLRPSRWLQRQCRACNREAARRYKQRRAA